MSPETKTILSHLNSLSKEHPYAALVDLAKKPITCSPEQYAILLLNRKHNLELVLVDCLPNHKTLGNVIAIAITEAILDADLVKVSGNCPDTAIKADKFFGDVYNKALMNGPDTSLTSNLFRCTYYLASGYIRSSRQK